MVGNKFGIIMIVYIEGHLCLWSGNIYCGSCSCYLASTKMTLNIINIVNIIKL